MVLKSMDKLQVKFSLLNGKEILITCRSVNFEVHTVYFAPSTQTRT